MSASFKTVGPNRALRPIAIATILALATFGLSAVGTGEASAIESKGSPRIVGGTDIAISFAPYQVALIDTTASNDFLGQFCGGSILSREIIVTAAHCFDADFVLDDLRILAGSETLSDEEKLADLEVSAVTIHPLWDAAAYAANTSTFENDIAIIQLAVPLTFQADTIEPISLPSQSSVLTANTPAYISGWGYTGVKNDLQQPVDENGDAFDENDEPITPVPFPTSLQGVTIYTGSDADCSSEIGEAFKSASMLCAGDFEIIDDPAFMRDTCSGDSGGPMAVDVDEVTTLAGITSWGAGCAWLEPGVYTKVSSYVNWIKSFLADLTDYTAALEAVVEADYTTASWDDYQVIVDANSATDQDTQADVDTATANIVAAQADLVPLANLTSYTAARAAVDEADYTTASWATYEAILTANVVTDQDLQVDVDTATANIVAAQADLIPNAPTVTGAAITGTAQVDVQLTSTATVGGRASITYVWEISDDGTTGWTAIVGATSSTYTPVAGDIAKFIRVVVTVTNVTDAASATSARTLAVAAAPVVSSPTPTSRGAIVAPPVQAPAPTPVAAPQTTRTQAFAANSAKLSKDLRVSIREALASNPNAKSAVCRGFVASGTATAADRKLARDRSTAVCNLITKLNPDLDVEVKKVVVASSSKQLRKVRMVLR